jgi:molybdopterin-biosynthesis enzyme MoeA-like protein
MDNVIKSILRRLASLEKRPTGSVTVTGGGGGTLDDLTDVTITTPSDGEVLTYDNVTGEWVNAAPTGGAGLTEEQKEQLELAYLRSIYYLAFK